jgi:hypothetical protein
MGEQGRHKRVQGMLAVVRSRRRIEGNRVARPCFRVLHGVHKGAVMESIPCAPSVFIMRVLLVALGLSVSIGWRHVHDFGTWRAASWRVRVHNLRDRT